MSEGARRGEIFSCDVKEEEERERERRGWVRGGGKNKYEPVDRTKRQLNGGKTGVKHTFPLFSHNTS